MPRTTKVAPFLGAFALAVLLSACGGDADALRQLDSIATNVDNVSRHATQECGTDLGHG